MLIAILAYTVTGALFWIALRTYYPDMPIWAALVLGAFIGTPTLVFGIFSAAAREIDLINGGPTERAILDAERSELQNHGAYYAKPHAVSMNPTTIGGRRP